MPAPADTARARWWLSAWLVVPVIAAVVMLARLPAIRLNDEMNVDESQMMAQALRLGVDTVPWRGMDGTTSGPVNSWALHLAHLAGMPLAYPWIHALSAAILASVCVLTYAALRQIAGKAEALAGSAAAAAFVALAQGMGDFCHYSSELIPALLTAGALLCIARRLTRPEHATMLDGTAGFLLGFMPWAKLQSVVAAGVLCLSIAWLILREERRGSKLRALLLFAISAALPTVLILGPVLLAGAWTDFWMSYVKANAAYAKGAGLLGTAKNFLTLLTHAPASAVLSGTLLFAAVWWAFRRPGWTHASLPLRQFLLIAVVLSAASVFAVLKPGQLFGHYQLLLFQPVVLVAACLLRIWLSDPTARTRLPGVLFAVLLLGFQLRAVPAAFRQAREVWWLRAKVERAPHRRILADLRTLAPAAKGMVVWGWMPRLYVETGIPPATRHAICHFLIEPGPARDYLRASFLADIQREKPDVIVDAVASGCFRWMGWNATNRLQSFPALDEYVRQNYMLAAERNFTREADPLRIYVSRAYSERMAAHPKP